MGFFIQLIRYEKELRARKEIDDKEPAVDEENPVKPLDPNIDPAENAVETQLHTDFWTKFAGHCKEDQHRFILPDRMSNPPIWFSIWMNKI